MCLKVSKCLRGDIEAQKRLYLHEKVPDALDVDPFQGPAEKMRKSALNGIGLSPNIEHNVRIVTDNFDLLK